MRLIGMLDSPYVRRLAISLHVLEIPFEHEALSVFGDFDRFHAINPVVKAPTLVCDDGTVLMDSTLILQYIESADARGRSLWSRDTALCRQQFRIVGLALAACDKGVQLVYERNLRPAAAQYVPWQQRVTGQLLAACTGLEQEVQEHTAVFADTLSQPVIAAAVAWQFLQSMLAAVVPADRHPGLDALSQQMEQSAAFRQYPPRGPGVVRSDA